MLEQYDLHGIDEDLNGRMFETFLSATIRGKELGHYFTPRPIVRYMSITSSLNVAGDQVPFILDGCCGTGGFLIEAMAILSQKIEAHPALISFDKDYLKDTVRDQRLFGIEANEDLARVARLNMYLHGDGGSRIYHSEALDKEIAIESGLSKETEDGRKELRTYLVDNTLQFDVVLTNPPFSMNYRSSDPVEKTILQQYHVAKTKGGKLSSTEKSSILFIERYLDLLRQGGELVTVIDDTVLNGPSAVRHRQFIRDNFVIRQIVSLPFNAFFKASANIKTSILHLRKRRPGEEQGTVFMAITNNVGHDDHKRDTPNRDNLSIVASYYQRWVNGEQFPAEIVHNEHPDEPLGCPLQIFTVPSDELQDRLDAFYYAPELMRLREQLQSAHDQEKIELKRGKDVPVIKELTSAQVQELSDDIYKYFEIGDVTRYGSIINSKEDRLEDLPTRGRLLVQANDVVFANNNSSRGTTVIIPQSFDQSIVTTGFIGIRPSSSEESLLWWSILSSEAVRKQIYYLAVSASQPEIRPEIFEAEFLLPYPIGAGRDLIMERSHAVRDSQNAIYDILSAVVHLQEHLLI